MEYYQFSAFVLFNSTVTKTKVDALNIQLYKNVNKFAVERY